MFWLLFVIVAALLIFWLVRHNRAEIAEDALPSFVPMEDEDETFAVIAAAIAEFEDEEAGLDEEDLLAVLTAAIAEFEEDDCFRVVSFRPRSLNWSQFGRQELMRSRA